MQPFCSGNAISNTYIECVFVALVIQHATCMRHITHTLSSVAFRLYSIFPHYLLTAWFLGKGLLNIKCIFIFSTNSVGNISHSKMNSARYYIKCTSVFISDTCHSRHISMKLAT